MTKRADKRQAGMAAILITLVTMVVVSLIVIGFVLISNRNQSNTVDQQLSTQAFYAAESGVNDAQKVIEEAESANPQQAIPPKTDCTQDSGSYPINYPTGPVMLDATHNVSYTCLLVDPNLTSLVYTDIATNSRVIPITTTSNITKINITWKAPAGTVPAGGPNNCPNTPLYDQPTGTGQLGYVGAGNGSWTCPYGLLRADVVPTAGYALTTASLANHTLTGFFVPVKNGGGTLGYAPGKANLVAADCNATQCSATLDVPSGEHFSLRLSFLYAKPASVTITALNGSGPVTITGTQVLVDSTGDANGVLRRIQVHLPATLNGNLIPDDAVQTNGSICKRFEVAPGSPPYFSIPGNFPSNNPDGQNQMCQAH